jgi:VWFA-related protein
VRRVITLVVCFSLLLPVVAAQEQAPPKFNANVNVVSIDAEVLDRDGNPVDGLAREDFVVKENGVPVPVTNFARFSDRPVSLAIVLDTSAIALEKLNVAKRFVFEFIHLIGRDDEISLFTLGKTDPALEVRFTTDRAPLIEALENISVPSRGSGGVMKRLFGGIPPTALAIDLALEQLRASRHPKKALLVISNRFVGLGPATVDHVQESGCTLLTLGFSNKAAMFITLGGDEISRKQLMRESGGRQFSAETEDVTGVCHTIAHSLKNYYSLGYQTEIRADEKKPRKIEVLVPGKRYTINARRTFIPG